MVKLAIKERRTSVRAKRVLSIEFKLKDSKQKNADRKCYLSLTEDMSVGGLSFYSQTKFHAGDVLDLHVVMSGVLDIFKGRARVVRVEERKGSARFFTAVQFLEQKNKKRAAKSYKGRMS